MNPGDTRTGAFRRSCSGPLNEGQGVNPGDTSVTSGSNTTVLLAQRRPGCEPRRHGPGDPIASAVRHAQRRPGCEPRRHHLYAQVVGRPRASLNEGQGVNPGDTWNVTSNVGTLEVAQRRPGCEPRRHDCCSVGSRVPSNAQRRPGCEPRRHLALRPLRFTML